VYQRHAVGLEDKGMKGIVEVIAREMRRDLGIPRSLEQAEAERLRRAKVINAEDEQQAAEKLVEAGRLLAREPQAMQLRYFAALHDTASERSPTIVFPLPTDLLTRLAPRSDGRSDVDQKRL
jgi:hypothetical protein